MATFLTYFVGGAKFELPYRTKLIGKPDGSYSVDTTFFIKEIKVDCDGDALLLLVDPAGPACHTGADSCFYRTLDERKKNGRDSQ